MKQSTVSQVRRKEIIDVAKDLFIEYGFEKTSVTQIAKKAEVAKGLVYYYFETKEDVLNSVIENLCLEHVGILQARLKEVKGDFFAQLLVLIDVYADLHPYLRYKELKDFDDTRLVAEFHARYLEGIHEELFSLTDKGRRLGYFELDYPKEMVVMALEGLYGLGRVQLPTRKMVAVLVEQTLNLPKDSLVEKSSVYLRNYNEEEGII